VTFASFFSVSEHPLVCYCADIHGLFQDIGINYFASDWRFLINSSKQSLKAVFLHNGNTYPSIPVAHSFQIKENSESVKIVLKLIRYKDHNWDVCGDFKMMLFYCVYREDIRSILAFNVCGTTGLMNNII